MATADRFALAPTSAADNAVAEKRVDFAYDVFNCLVGRSLDPDGDGPLGTTVANYIYDGDQIVLEFDGAARTDVSHRYLWGPAVDQILADEQVTVVSSIGTMVHPLADHLGTPWDLATYNGATDVTTIANHRVYDSSGNRKSETDAAVDHVFGFTGRLFDEATELQNNANRWYDPAVGRWLSLDPIGFAAGDPNLYRYVGNALTMYVDPSGLDVVSGYGQFEVYVDGSRSESDLLGVVHYNADGSQAQKAVASQVANEKDRKQEYFGHIWVTWDPGAIPDAPASYWKALREKLGLAPYSPPRCVPLPIASEKPREYFIGPASGPDRSRGYQDELLSRARDCSLPISQRAAAIDAYLEGQYASAAISPWERAAIDFFRPRGYQPGIGGTSCFEGALMGSLGATSALRSAYGAPANAGTFVDQMTPAEAARYRAYWAQDYNPVNSTRQRLYTTPGTRSIVDQKLSHTGEVYSRETIYDQFGRRIGTNDFTTHGRPTQHTNPHYHPNPWNNPTQHGPALPGLHPETPR